MSEITVVIPAYNIEPYLDRCFETLCNQSFKNFHVIAINDGSTDQTLVKLYEWQKKDDRILVIDKENEGVGMTRNAGLKRVNTPYVIFIDPDDYMHPKMLEKLYTKAKETDADLIICDYIEWYESNDEQNVVKMPRFNENKISIKEHKKCLTKINPAPWNKLIKVEVLKASGVRFPTDMRSEDLVFTQLLLANIKSLSVCEEPLYYYLANRLNNVSSTYDKRILHTLKAVCLIREYYENNGMLTKYYSELESITLNQLRYELKKVPFINDDELAADIMNSFYQYLKQYFPKWRKNTYYKELLNTLSVKQQIQEKIYDSKWKLAIYRKVKKLK